MHWAQSERAFFLFLFIHENGECDVKLIIEIYMMYVLVAAPNRANENAPSHVWPSFSLASLSHGWGWFYAAKIIHTTSEWDIFGSKIIFEHIWTFNIGVWFFVICVSAQCTIDVIDAISYSKAICLYSTNHRRLVSLLRSHNGVVPSIHLWIKRNKWIKCVSSVDQWNIYHSHDDHIRTAGIHDLQSAPSHKNLTFKSHIIHMYAPLVFLSLSNEYPNNYFDKIPSTVQVVVEHLVFLLPQQTYNWQTQTYHIRFPYVQIETRFPCTVCVVTVTVRLHIFEWRMRYETKIVWNQNFSRRITQRTKTKTTKLHINAVCDYNSRCCCCTTPTPTTIKIQKPATEMSQWVELA